jgi:hypothetical protein
VNERGASAERKTSDDKGSLVSLQVTSDPGRDGPSFFYSPWFPDESADSPATIAA